MINRVVIAVFGLAVILVGLRALNDYREGSVKDAPRPITRTLQQAAHDLDMPPVPDNDVGLLRHAQITAELARRERERAR